MDARASSQVLRDLGYDPPQAVQRPELRRPFKHGGFLRPFYGVSTAVDKRPKLLRPRKLWAPTTRLVQLAVSSRNLSYRSLTSLRNTIQNLAAQQGMRE